MNYCCEECQLAQERIERGEQGVHECQCLHADCANIPAPVENEVPDGLDVEPVLAPA
jgi:hypothetical protein